MKMETQKRAERARKMEMALAETLKECRDKIAAHFDVEPDAGPLPRNIYYTVQDLLEIVDETIEDLVSDRDYDIDQAVDEFGQ
jgi:hypothetical protein